MKEASSSPRGCVPLYGGRVPPASVYAAGSSTPRTMSSSPRTMCSAVLPAESLNLCKLFYYTQVVPTTIKYITLVLLNYPAKQCCRCRSAVASPLELVEVSRRIQKYPEVSSSFGSTR
eukprot:SAG11_NODE_104_length_16539_cov_8.526642_10_plen_118_part_00